MATYLRIGFYVDCEESNSNFLFIDVGWRSYSSMNGGIVTFLCTYSSTKDRFACLVL